MYSTNDCYFIRHRHSPTAIAKYLLCVLFSFTHTLCHPVRMVSILMSFFVYIFAIAFEHRVSVFVIIMCRSHQLNDGVDDEEWVGCQHTTLIWCPTLIHYRSMPVVLVLSPSFWPETENRNDWPTVSYTACRPVSPFLPVSIAVQYSTQHIQIHETTLYGIEFRKFCNPLLLKHWITNDCVYWILTVSMLYMPCHDQDDM